MERGTLNLKLMGMRKPILDREQLEERIFKAEPTIEATNRYTIFPFLKHSN